MSVESIWYASYVDGQPPKCRRLLRLSTDEQWHASLELAIAIARGDAGYRPVHRRVPASGIEYWWYWPNQTVDTRVIRAAELRERGVTFREIAEICGYASAQQALTAIENTATGWWLIPERVVRNANDLIQAAVRCDCHRLRGGCGDEDIVRRLRIWRRSSKWRRKVLGRRPPDSLGDGYAAWYRRTFPTLRARRRGARKADG
jgi:hypothetical protein